MKKQVQKINKKSEEYSNSDQILIENLKTNKQKKQPPTFL